MSDSRSEAPVLAISLYFPAEQGNGRGDGFAADCFHSQQTSSVIAGLWHARPSPHFRGWAPKSCVIRQPQGEFGPLERGFIAKSLRAPFCD